MKLYSTYTPADFLTDDWFLTWVHHNQPEARLFWEDFQAQYPNKRADLLLAKDMAEALLQNRPGKLLSEEQVQSEVNQIMRLTRPTRSMTVVRRLWLQPRVRAGLLLLLTIIVWRSWYLFPVNTTLAEHQALSRSEQQSMPHKSWQHEVNGTSQPVSLLLPDKSRLVLQPHSEIRYPTTFSPAKREVWLTGAAYFSVVHDANRPFLVHSGSLVTRVLGTRFRVNAPANESQITVSVESGKVSVYDQQELGQSQQTTNRQVPGVILTANQQVVYDAKRASYQKELVASPTLIDPTVRPEQFEFQDTPIPVVFGRLQKSYGITIQYDAVLFEHCTLTASLAGVPLHDQFSLICASIGATYQIVDTQIVVTGKGCH